MSKLHHVSNLYYIPSQGMLAEWLVKNSCGDKVFFCNSGAEANEGAIKLARKHAISKGATDPVVLTAVNSFHGRTLGALSATQQPKYHKGFTYGGRMVQGFKPVKYNDVSDLEKQFRKYNRTPFKDWVRGRKRRVAAIMLEPLQGEGGITPGDKEYFLRARSLCDATGALMICDEVQVGMGRSGTLWGYQNISPTFTPDVFTTAKALGGGVPIGAMIAGGKASTVLGPGEHATTYGGNPLACAAGLAVAKELSGGVLENVKSRGEELKVGLEGIKGKYGDMVEDVRGWGLLMGLELKEPNMAGDVVGRCMKKGLLLVPAGLRVVRFVPPLIVKKEEIEEAVRIFGEVMEDIKEEGMGK